jgi:hypothetical protein
MAMRTGTLLLGSLFGAIGLALAASLFGGVMFFEQRQLQSDQQSLRTELEQARTQAREWTEERETMNAELVGQRARVEELSSEVMSLREATAGAEQEMVRLPVQSHRVRAYLGNQQVGMGWLVPHQMRTNKIDGRVSYEPVIVLDESVRQRVAGARTEPVEPEPQRPTSVTYNYQNYAGSWPVWWVRPAPGKPIQPSPPSTPSPQPPREQSPFLSRQIWHPQNVPGRPGGEWIMGGTAPTRPLPAPVNPGRSSPFPARY